MKNFALALLLSILAPGASAQNFEFGINGGIVFNSLRDGYFGDTYASFSEYRSSAVSAKAMYTTHKYQIGVAVTKMTFLYNAVYSRQYSHTGGLSTPIQHLGGFGVLAASSQFTDHEMPLTLFINRVLSFKKLEAYGGLSVAYRLNKIKQEQDNSSLWTAPLLIKSKNRWGAGIHIGASYFITKHFGINAEVACEYANYPMGPLDNNTFSYPVTLGVRYKLQ